jgi:hypothetical protein
MTTPAIPDHDTSLNQIVAKMNAVHEQAGIGGKALGVPELDWQLWRMGRQWLSRNAPEIALAQVSPSRSSPQGPDVYLATLVYEDGGHTALIGDFVRALGDHDTHSLPATRPHLIVSNIGEDEPPANSDSIASRVDIPSENITYLQGATLQQRLENLFALLLKLQPGRLFLFHHPDDPLPSVVAHPEIAGQRFLVHHADSIPSFGMHLPGIQIIDLNPVASAISRAQKLSPALLLLSSPDPGPRPHGFLKRGKLTTATSGRAPKYDTPYVYTYAETVAVVLIATQGWHVHIGPLADSQLDQIHTALAKAEIPEDRFIHVPWVPSVAEALWEYHCDLYFSSFPIDGARTNTEVAASGTPHLRHATNAGRHHHQDRLALDGGLVWNIWEDLSTTLQEVSNPAILEKKSQQIRSTYDRLYHPGVFADTLNGILHGDSGIDDPEQESRDRAVILSMMKSLTAALIDANNPGDHTQELERQRDRIDFLQDKRRLHEEKIRKLTEQLRQLKSPPPPRPGLLTRLRRLLRPS